MTYAPYSSTSPNTPVLTVNQPIGSQRAWLYVSTHARAVVVASTHITDGLALGMKKGDSVYVGESTAAAANSASDINLLSHHVARTVASTYVTLSEGWLISSAS